MSKLTLPTGLTRFAGNVALKARKNAPEILLVTGIVAGIGTVVLACKETVKAGDVVEQFKDDMDDIELAHTIHENGGEMETADGSIITTSSAEDYDDNAYKKDKLIAYGHLGLGLSKTYFPAILLGSLSLACILTSHGILKKRELAAVATSAALRTAFDEYRTRVAGKVGEDVERKLYYGIEKKDGELVETDESGKEKKKKVRYESATCGSMYSRFYDESIPDFRKSGMANFEAILSDVRTLNYKLIANGHLFLNDVYKQLGLPISCQGQMAGWIYDPKDPDNTILKLVGMEHLYFTNQGTIAIDYNDLSDEWKALHNDFQRSILLDFVNIKDNILEDLPRIDSKVTVV